MAGLGSTAKAPSLPPPRPKSPPEYPDLYGKRRELAKVQMLEREIRFLEDELKFVEGLQPASRSCKDVADYATANSDPLMPATKRVHRSCCFWKWLCGSSCFSFSWICCQGCVPHLEIPRCCGCSNLCDCSISSSCPSSCPSCTSIRCSKPKCHCCSCSCFSSLCFRKPACGLSCRIPKCPSCSNCCFCNGCTSCYPKCLKVNLCNGCCTKGCCYNCYICY
ncbi:guanine nucleotide-binding protein subunit gamma 3-like [Coffea arabica]|uniref:Guanine nucleotide-binding protein subunit gamma 3-like n=1 Tax=Coffea arabica TaxID=13443 RepID=A0ABM4UYW8_COFAR